MINSYMVDSLTICAKYSGDNSVEVYTSMLTTKKVQILLAAAFLSNGAIVHADSLAAVMWGGPAQSSAVCYLFNSGPGTVSITSSNIYSELGGTVPIIWTDCGTTLTTGSVCAYTANIPVQGAYACNIVISPSATNVRGEMEIRDNTGKILNSRELR